MMIFDLFDLVGEHDEAAVDFVELVTIKLMAQLFTAQAERVPSRMFAQHQFRIRHAQPIAGS